MNFVKHLVGVQCTICKNCDKEFYEFERDVLGQCPHCNQALEGFETIGVFDVQLELDTSTGDVKVTSLREVSDGELETSETKA